MIFGPVPPHDALGAILAHSVALPGRRLRKGLCLGPDDIAAIQAAGLAEVTVAQLQQGDVDEDTAAQRLARAVVPAPDDAGLALQPVGTGRVNIRATGAGILNVDAARIEALNSVHPMITLCTLPPLQRVADATMCATVKIISYAVPDVALQAACAAGAGAINRIGPRLRRAVLIQTQVPGGADLSQKGQAVTAQRLSRLGVEMGQGALVPHAVAPLAREVARAAARADLVLILTGSATSDPADVAPSALRQAGGTVTHFGMPVDPGNLLFLGALGDVPVIGLPGCARAPALNGADWVLERIVCGLEVTARDIMRMGVGGLLKEMPSRPHPRGQAQAD